MPKNILLLQGHPDASGMHFGHSLADAYAHAAQASGHDVRTIRIAELELPLLRSKAMWESGALPPVLQPAQEGILWAGHIVLFFPLWLGGMPAMTKGFLEQVLRPGFALGKSEQGGIGTKLLKGRSARIVVTMGMPALVYRWYFRAHSLKALERNILGLVGIAPVHETLIGQVEGMGDIQREQWLRKLATLGSEGA
ncbi:MULTISPECIES: NAD(P)H-dependent oxidoreductase [unclassified Variovorax]|uniref:NAD(P)H-dependent oxidoreductase n=1 Tax=unclassified Variovorax TaxID=663243 RepID=UPI000D120730|nr:MULTISPECIES: NAD(P)H-dependent oxidoreductase [unclassified Variovorax]AVQ85817.1 dehydrogenase [Variovorax sp. PMC12]QRY35252.1 NAD(P)H-dependent oxidoreductase [Variovorax sp. PDNC026]